MFDISHSNRLKQQRRERNRSRTMTTMTDGMLVRLRMRVQMRTKKNTALSEATYTTAAAISVPKDEAVIAAAFVDALSTT